MELFTGNTITLNSKGRYFKGICIELGTIAGKKIYKIHKEKNPFYHTFIQGDSVEIIKLILIEKQLK